MELEDTLRRRRMVRRFEADRIPSEVLARVLEAGLSAPSAGFAQGLDLVVIEERSTLERFWETTDPRGRKRPSHDPPVVVIPCTSVQAYVERYSSPDKAGTGLDAEERWPVPYWYVDAGMGVMAILLSAVDQGLGAWFFGIFHGEQELRSLLSIPATHKPVGAIALGYAHPDDVPIGSSVTIPKRRSSDCIHLGSWGRSAG